MKSTFSTISTFSTFSTISTICRISTNSTNSTNSMNLFFVCYFKNEELLKIGHILIQQFTNKNSFNIL